MKNRDIDSIIAHLRSCGTETSSNFNLLECEMHSLCENCIKTLRSQPMLLKIETPVTICGDIHGHFQELLRIFERGGFPPTNTYLFLGDYVDRGKHSLESICLLIAYKLKYPNRFFLLRGNHECKSINYRYGFYEECVDRYTARLWRSFNKCFDFLPVAAIVGTKIFCCHGGLSPHLQKMEQIEKICRPTIIPRKGLLCDLLWSDPGQNSGWHPSPRGAGVLFGEDTIYEFVQKHNLKLIVRAHEVCKNGYKLFANNTLITIFSVSNYCGMQNDGAIVIVNENFMCTFKVLKCKSK